METFRTFNISKNLFFTSVLLFIFSLSYSQIPSYENGTYSIELTNGISTPTGDFENFAETGFNSGITLNKIVCNNIAIGFSSNYSSLAVVEEFGVSNENWKLLSINVGPKYQLNINSLNIQLYGHLGVSFIKVPEINSFYPNSEVILTSFKQANTSALNTRLGINLGIKICKGLQFYVASEYTSHLNGDINYSTRDLSNAVILNETIDPEAAEAIGFSPKNFSISTLNTNFGIRLDMGGNRSTRATDHNSSRSNKTSHTPATGDGGGDGDESGKGKATDHNSSRSNKTSHTPATGDGGGDDDDGKGKATDHNSSRSNKTSHTPATGDGGGDDDDGKGKATDHNSSRSNKTSHTPATGDDGDNDGGGKGKATDHNSSRSNKTSNNPIKVDDGDNDGDGGGKGKATDHNSSRSNKTSNNPIKVDDGDNDGDGGGKGKATDHNSSRSNKTSSSKEIDDPIVSITQEGVVEIGTLLRILLDARKFEFKKNNGHLIIGNIDSTISVNKLAEFNRRYLNKPSKVVLIVKKTLFKSGRAEVNYELLNVVDK